MDPALLNWPAVILGTVLAFGLGMIWFSPRMFGARWAAGSHGISAPDRAPVLAMALMALGLFLLALVVGLTETNEAIGTAIAAVLAVAVTVAAIDLFSQKSTVAMLIDAGYLVACGVLMIGAQGLL